MGGSAGPEGGAAERTADDVIDVLQCRGSGGVGGCGGRVEGEGGGGRWNREGHVGGEEHVIGLD